MAEEMIYHRMRSTGNCSCGYKYRPGESIMLHRAKVMNIVLILNDAGISLDDMHEAVGKVMEVANAA